MKMKVLLFVLMFSSLASASEPNFTVPVVSGGSSAECLAVSGVTGVDYQYSFKIEWGDEEGGDQYTRIFTDTDSDGNVVYANVFSVVSDDGVVFNWNSLNDPIHAVISKGGRGSNVYVYPDGSSSDVGLQSPVNNSGGSAAISHITFCWNPPESPVCELWSNDALDNKLSYCDTLL